MTGGAIIRGTNMIGAFTRCYCAIVATDTLATDAGVIKIGRLPATRRMALIALCRCGYVPGIFSFCLITVMTVTALTSNIRMIKPRGTPGIGAMAGITFCRGL